jgi:hypothetical protein
MTSTTGAVLGILVTDAYGITLASSGTLPYDTSTQFNRQYPRVALTIMTVPQNAGQNWSQFRYLESTVTHACFSLALRMVSTVGLR